MWLPGHAIFVFKWILPIILAEAIDRDWCFKAAESAATE
jgi:hypothetical protein